MTLNPNWFLNATGQFQPVTAAGIVTSTATTTGFLTYLTKSTTADITLTTTLYVDGPSVAQGSSGIWYASGTITLVDGAAARIFRARLWDGTTIIASAENEATLTSVPIVISLSGVIASPAGNIRISAECGSAGTSNIKFNASGDSADSTVTAIRIG